MNIEESITEKKKSFDYESFDAGGLTDPEIFGGILGKLKHRAYTTDGLMNDVHRSASTVRRVLKKMIAEGIIEEKMYIRKRVYGLKKEYRR